MKKHFPFILFSCIIFYLCAGNRLHAQNVGINATGAVPHASAMLDVAAVNKGVLLPRVALTGTTDVATIPAPATSLLVYNTAIAGTSPNAVTPGYYYWDGAKWKGLITSAGSVIPFSSGIIRSGAQVVSSAPLLMGFGSSTVQTINASGESTMPPEAGGFSFVVPASGIIQNLQVSADLQLASAGLINVVGLQYDFTVFVSPSVPNNGVDHLAQPYLTTPFTTSVRFGAPNTFVPSGTFRAATNINTGSLAVNAGDRIGIRVRTLQSTDISAFDITQLSFAASLTYTPVQ